jgi:hypothetical protein
VGLFIRTIAVNHLIQKICLLAVLACAALLCGPSLRAQGNRGRILGTVTDQSGGVILGANVTITNVATSITRRLVTDSAGEYVAPDLEPGPYTIHIEATGFKQYDRPNLELEVGKDLQIDAALATGSASETITVTEEAPIVDASSATLGGTISNTEINDLPLNGRNYQNLLTLRPGITRYAGGGFSTLSTNGLRPEDNVFILDGLNDDEPFSGQSMINGPPLYGDTTTTLPIDAIQEFNTIESPKAEYGWKPGAIVNVGLKSGTNTTHGTAYGFGRDNNWDAENYFLPEPLPTTLEQYGGTIGGAIKKDKLFYFGGYEGQRYSATSPYVIQLPATVSLVSQSPTAVGCAYISSGNCQASIPDAIADLEAGGITPNALSLKLAQLFPTNLGTNPTGPTSFSPRLLSNLNQNNAIGKIDYRLNDNNLITGNYFFGQLNGVVNDNPNEIAEPWQLAVHTRSQVFGVNWIRTISPTWINEARFGYSRFFQPSQTVDHDVNPTTYGINTGVTNPEYFGLGTIQTKGFAPLGQSYLKIQGPDQVFQFSDSVSHTIGKHALKFGAEYRHDEVVGASYKTAKGIIKFGNDQVFAGTPACLGINQDCGTPLEAFLAGVPDKGQLLLGNPLVHVHYEQFAAFLQDDFRVTRTLTLNLGVRYELNTVIKATNNKLANFDPARGIVQVGDGISAPFNGDHNNFAPRFGFAWDVFGRGKTVLRGGVGVAYETLTANLFLLYANSLGLNSNPSGAIIDAAGNTSGGNIVAAPITYPGSALNWTLAGPVFQNTATTLNCFLNPCTLLGVNPNIRTPYVTTYNLNIQHALTSSTSLEVGYVGNHGSKLLGVRDVNQVDPNSPEEIACGHCEQNGRPYFNQFPYLSYINVLSNQDISNYNALQVTLVQRNFHGLASTAGYTYSHSLDDASSNWGIAPPQDSLHTGAEYASGDFDIRHRFTLATTYSLPSRDGYGQMLKGWQLNSLVTLQSAMPWTVQDTADDFSLTGEVNNPAWLYSGGERWDFNGKPSDFTSGPTALPYYPAGTAPGDAGSIPACVNAATATGGTLNAGCYAVRGSALIAPQPGTFGTMARNLFRDSGFRNWDLSVTKLWTFKERYGFQFRAEFFNVLNHPNFANPYGAQNGFGAGAYNDPSAPGAFGCGCATPDVAASNPVLGSGGNRKLQLGLKFQF